MNTLKLLLSTLVMFVFLQANVFAVGAIALGDADPKAEDTSSEQHFVVSGAETQEAAERAAEKQCLAKGLHFCHAAVWYEGCGAYAKSAKSSGAGLGATMEEAKTEALASCGKNCVVVISQCEKGF